MALARVTTWSSGQALKASDLNGEFNSILNNALSLISPLTGSLNFNTNQALSLVLEKLPVPPVAANQGRVWYNTAINDPQFDQGAGLPTLSFRAPIGQCRLVYQSTTQLLVQPYNGNLVPVKTGSAWEMRPIATTSGIPISSTMAAASTSLYYAYVFNSSGALTGTLSTNPHATSTETGVEIMSTDATRTLVGMALTSTSTGINFQQDAANRLVASWFNRRNVGLLGAFTANRSPANSNYNEVSTEIRVGFLTWADEAVVVGISGSVGNSVTIGATSLTAPAFDSTSVPEDVFNSIQQPTGASGAGSCPVGVTLVKNGLSEGYHFATLLGTSTGNGAYQGSVTAGQRTTLTVGIRV